jgi:hypothetical protein
MRNYEQCRRRAFEENLVRAYYRESQVYDRRGSIYYIVPINKPDFTNSYKLKLQLSESHPYTEPEVLVQSPITLWLKDGKSSINSLGTSHAYHVFGNGSGSAKICYTSDWTPAFNCITALWRSELWLAAFEIHRITGETIDEIFRQWKERLRKIDERSYFMTEA